MRSGETTSIPQTASIATANARSTGPSARATLSLVTKPGRTRWNKSTRRSSITARTRRWFLTLAARTHGVADSHAWPGSIAHGFAGNLLHLLDPNVAEADLQAGFFRGVQLQSDPTVTPPRIAGVDRGDAVDPALDRVVHRLDTKAVPFTRLAGLPRRLVVLECLQPAATPAFVQSAGPLPAGRIDLDLIADHVSRFVMPPREDVSPVEIVGIAFLRMDGRADLNTRVEALVDLEVDFEDEVVERPRLVKLTRDGKLAESLLFVETRIGRYPCIPDNNARRGPLPATAGPNRQLPQVHSQLN